MAWFHEVGDGGAIQGFVGKKLRLDSGWGEHLGAGFAYGMARTASSVDRTALAMNP